METSIYSSLNLEFYFEFGFDEIILCKRYWVNEAFFDGTGPVFIMIGGEGEENPIWMENGQWINFAKQYVTISLMKKIYRETKLLIYLNLVKINLKKALCVMLEHRYYGKSRPTE